MTNWKLISKRDSTFDWWSLIHFGFFAWLGSAIEAGFSPAWWVHVLYWVVLTVVWEVFEMFAEKKWPKAWRYKVEHWSNHWIGDPIVNGLGIVFGAWVVGQ